MPAALSLQGETMVWRLDQKNEFPIPNRSIDQKWKIFVTISWCRQRNDAGFV